MATDNMCTKKMKVKFFTLGCKVNQYETEALKEEFTRYNFEITDRKADFYVINTCTVTHSADTKSKEAIIKARRENPQSKIIACGCLAQLNSDYLQRLGVDYIVPQDRKQYVVDFIIKTNIEGNKDIWSLKINTFFHKRAFVKIQDGCNNFCTFCKIPYLRGPSRSRKKEDIIDEVKRLIPYHYEIVLCGINLGLYGKDINPKTSLAELLRDVLKIEGLGRIRLSSLEPSLINEDLLDLFKNQKLCPHLHLPFQSGDDTILRLMNKKETTRVYYNVVEKVRKIRPLIAISCDIMVGFPSEEDKHFKNTVNFLHNIRPMRMHIFRFSPRENTVFSGMVLKGQRKIKERLDFLKKMKDKFSYEYRKKFVNKSLFMVAEERKNGYTVGYTENYIRPFLKENVPLGSVKKVRVSEVSKEKTFVIIDEA